MSSPAYRLSRSTTTGSAGASFFFTLIAGAFAVAGFYAYMIIFWPFALLAVIAAILSDPKEQHITYCEACGNDVAPTSKRCRHCQTELIAPPRPRRRLSPILLGTLIFAALIALFFLWLSLRS